MKADNSESTDSQIARLVDYLKVTPELAQLLVPDKDSASFLISVFKNKFYLTRLAEEFSIHGFSESRMEEVLSEEINPSSKKWKNIAEWLKKISKNQIKVIDKDFLTPYKYTYTANICIKIE